MKNLEKETYVVPNEKSIKLVIHSAKVLGSRYGHIMRTTLPDEAYMQVKDIANQTGLSAENVIRRMVEFALPYTEVIQ
ncbi:MAG: hypothetical protein PUB08_00850 [Firmicutes bacterium]|nr:hypothetical protein [Bacillota bacterium]